MDDVIERVREYAKNLTNNGAPHQTGIGRDILKVVDLVDVTSAKTTVVMTKNGANRLLDETISENKRLAQAVAEAAAENAQLRAALDAATVNTAKGDEQSKDLAEPDASQKQKRKKG